MSTTPITATAVKRPRRKATPKLPYPDMPAPLIGSDAWQIQVQRHEAKLAALRAHVNKVWSKASNGPLADALAHAIVSQVEDLERSRECLAYALDQEQRGGAAC